MFIVSTDGPGHILTDGLALLVPSIEEGSYLQVELKRKQPQVEVSDRLFVSTELHLCRMQLLLRGPGASSAGSGLHNSPRRPTGLAGRGQNHAGILSCSPLAHPLEKRRGEKLFDGSHSPLTTISRSLPSSSGRLHVVPIQNYPEA